MKVKDKIIFFRNKNEFSIQQILEESDTKYFTLYLIRLRTLNYNKLIYFN